MPLPASSAALPLAEHDSRCPKPHFPLNSETPQSRLYESGKRPMQSDLEMSRGLQCPILKSLPLKGVHCCPQ